MQTPYSQTNQTFSDSAHMVARSALYPRLFNCKENMLTFEDTSLGMSDRATILDGEMGIDRIVNVSVPSLHGPLVFTIQERFRRQKFSSFTDITITEYNRDTGHLSELYKMNAGLFVYGFFCDKNNVFSKWVAVDVNKMLYCIAVNKLKYSRALNRRSNQDFIAIEVASLKNSDCILGGINPHLWGVQS